MTRVLFVAPELFGLASTGGLGDVAAALPPALVRLGFDVRVMLPAYAGVFDRVELGGRRIAIDAPAAGGKSWIVDARLPDRDVPLLLVDHPPFYERKGGPYGDERGRDFPDNAVRFALLSQAAWRVASDPALLGWSPDVVHANDWPTGLVPALIATRPGATRARTVFTIHNLAYPGMFAAGVFPALGLPPEAFGVDGVEFYGDVSYMKAGIFYADRVTTVSPTYAREIQTPAFGCGFDGLLASRRADLTGILNGVDYARWNPESDEHIAAPYSVASLAGKAICKAALQREYGLPERDDVLLLGNVSRLVPQKGLDLLLAALPLLAEVPLQLALLGTGERDLERGFIDAATALPQTVGVRIGFDDALAHRIEAGADAFVMPSRFEPCGLNQLYSLKYGTPPIVHRVGGLADSVEDG
ncbi:MAG TPA: glycogen synthase GlgA, partial [Candidatus Eremiobacteraceae bacterium]|nr:glycogen synthase GlgA [Candidatus Eremiobacteraceae bacterium]